METFIRNLRGTPCPSGSVVRREIFLHVGGFEENLRRGEDIALWVKIAAIYPILYDDRILFRYRRHSASSTSRSRLQGLKEQWELEFHCWLLAFIQSQPGLRRLHPVAEISYHNALRRYAIRQGWWRSRILVSKGLVRFPSLLRRRLWWLLLDWILPFNLSKRIESKIGRLVSRLWHYR